jgi:hypothetical protein
MLSAKTVILFCSGLLILLAYFIWQYLATYVFHNISVNYYSHMVVPAITNILFVSWWVIYVIIIMTVCALPFALSENKISHYGGVLVIVLLFSVLLIYAGVFAVGSCAVWTPVKSNL